VLDRLHGPGAEWAFLESRFYRLVLDPFSLGQVSSEATNIQDPDGLIGAVLRAEGDARRSLSEIRQKYRIPEPRGFGLSRSLRRDLSAYQGEFARLEKNEFGPAAAGIDSAVTEFTQSHDVRLDRRRRFDLGSTTAVETARSETRILSQQARATLYETSDRVNAALRRSIGELEESLNETLGMVGVYKPGSKIQAEGERRKP